MCEMPKPQTQSQTDGPVEPKPIVYIGGSMNGKAVADTGQLTYQTPTGDVYRRVSMASHNEWGTMNFCIMAFFGKSWDLGE